MVVGSTPNIFHLVELKDTYDRYVVMISIEESARILEIHLGKVTEELWRERPELRQRLGREVLRRELPQGLHVQGVVGKQHLSGLGQVDHAGQQLPDLGAEDHAGALGQGLQGGIGIARAQRDDQ